MGPTSAFILAVSFRCPLGVGIYRSSMGSVSARYRCPSARSRSGLEVSRLSIAGAIFSVSGWYRDLSFWCGLGIGSVSGSIGSVLARCRLGIGSVLGCIGLVSRSFGSVSGCFRIGVDSVSVRYRDLSILYGLGIGSVSGSIGSVSRCVGSVS